MRLAHKLTVLVLAIALLLLLLLLPRPGAGQSGEDFGDYLVHYSAIATDQLQADIAREYGIERSARRGLLNIAVEPKSSATPHMVNADVSASVSTLTGHASPIAVRETSENGDIDYLGEFPLQGSGTYRYTVRVTPPGHNQPYVLRFNQDYVVD